MELGNLVLKVSQVGSTVLVKNITPPELMILIADNHQNAGGDPVVKLDTVEPAVEEAQVVEIEKAIDIEQKKLAKLDKEDITPEVYEKREAAFRRRLQAAEDSLAKVKAIQSLRSLPAHVEKRRLVSKYGARKVNQMFADKSPNFPQTFAEARPLGLEENFNNEKDPFNKMLMVSGDQS